MNKNISLVIVPILLLSGCSTAQTIQASPSESEGSNATITAYVPPWKPEMSDKFDTPWPTNVSREELINSALFNAYEFFDRTMDPECEMGYNLHLGDPVVGEAAEVATNLVDKTIQMYCNYITEEINVIGGNYDFTKEVMAEEGYKTDEHGGVCGTGDVDVFAGACAFGGTAWFPMITVTRNGETQIEGRRLTIAAHEIFHIIHDQMDPDVRGSIPPPGHELFRTAWFVEGGGEFFGRITASYLDLYPYDKATPTDRGGLFLETEYLADLELLEVRRNRAFGTENYFSGQVAMEYMIASKSVDDVFQVWLNLGKGMDFYEAFESAMGITVAEFYDTFKILMDNMYPNGVVDNS